MNEMIQIQKSRLLSAFLFVLVSLAAISGCTVKLISSYDENTDKAVTQLQRNFETFFITIENQAGTSQCNYENHKKFYQDSTIDLSAIEVRAKALDKNEITVEQIGLLKDSLDKLKQLHEIGCFTPNQVSNLRDSFNTSITAILKLEIAKKRGDD